MWLKSAERRLICQKSEKVPKVTEAQLQEARRNSKSPQQQSALTSFQKRWERKGQQRRRRETLLKFILLIAQAKAPLQLRLRTLLLSKRSVLMQFKGQATKETDRRL